MQKYSVDFTDKIPPNVILALAPKLSSDSSLHTMIGDLNPTISKPLSATTIPIVSKKTQWSCHKDVLRSSSNYFKSIFNSQLHEVEASIVFLPNGIFSASVLDIMLYYMYNKSIFIEDETDIEVLQSLYLASDYLGLESLCATIEQHITINLAHSFNCYCENCITIVPFLLSFAGSNQQNNPSLSKMAQSIVKLLIQDPEKTLSTFWTSQSMVTLFTQNPEMELLHEYLENNLLKHVNKSNAIESLYGCFLAEEVLIKKGKEFQTKLLEGTIQKVRESGSSILANKFDFYCTKYPKLLSCVDGITYSFDFLNYVMSIVLDQQMNERNACLLYEGVVKHLMCRHTFQNSPLVRTILQSAKERIIKYISSNIFTIKKLDLIDQTIIDPLAHGKNDNIITKQEQEINLKSINRSHNTSRCFNRAERSEAQTKYYR